MFRLDGKVVVVTGAESGIGRAIALSCAQAGARVVVGGLVAEGLAGTVELIRSAGGCAIESVCDIRRSGDVEALFDRAASEFGGIDAAVANAGIIGSQASLEEIKESDFRSVLEVNVVGTFLTVQAASRRLIAQRRGGSIIATGSSSVLRAAPRLSSYAASKGAVHALMQALAVELGPHGIRVNTLVPGTTATDATRALPGYLDKVAAALPMGAVVEPDELGRYVAFVLSDACPRMTGSLLKLDGGRTIV